MRNETQQADPASNSQAFCRFLDAADVATRLGVLRCGKRSPATYYLCRFAATVPDVAAQNEETPRGQSRR
ncbi:hypothetical protein FYK55_18300 [Roseiconus nitratireducens]|uniref:Uncharacterized protein n=1 Tax=Roseiconus nitratireducens TaxID=2605748 RepID=A0A5M6D6Q5_9BACT|nr:hypothetical protein [Roseiconus nitratireducens]KAA5541509.1 hypothetical protein FYK55_18300 [Roseiconus nitratireducens]